MSTVFDILRFPLNKTGLAHIGLFSLLIFARLFVEFVLKELLGPLAMYVLWGLAFINILVGLQIIHYLYLCIQESAQGALTAPDNLFADTFKLERWSNLLGEYLFRVSPYLICFLPAILYQAFTERIDTLFVVLLAAGGVYFPMLFLAVAMFNSSAAFNPFIHLFSIIKTFFAYGLLVVQVAALIALFVLCVMLLQHKWLASFLLFPIQIYYMIIIAHLIGRYYCHYEARLNWEV